MVVIMASVDSWLKLFDEAKYSACCLALREKREILALKDDDRNRHDRILTLENNLFVCDQLNQSWDLETEENAAAKWSSGYSDIIDLYNRVRCQHICSMLPLDLILTVTCNAMWWGIMKVDPCDQQPCQKEVMNAAIYSLNTVRKLFGGRNPERRSYESIETNFIDAVHDAISCLPKLTSRQLQLSLEIICLGILSWADNFEALQEPTKLRGMIDSLVDILPQVKVHLSVENKTTENFETLLKFGWKETAEIFNETSFSTISEKLLSVVSVFYCRCNSNTLLENSSKVLKYLNLIDKSNLLLPFLYHYLHAFANFNNGNLDASLYHLQHSSMSSPNFFMQARLKTLKGQILLLQEKASEALEVLQSVQYKRKEVQLPLCAFHIANAYQMLGKFKHQIDVLNLLSHCLTAEQAIKPKLISPLAGIQHRLLLSVHSQPEVSADHVIQTIAAAHLSAEQPKEAADKLLELLYMKSFVMDGVGGTDDTSMWKLSELFHDAACALLKAHSVDDAEKVCEAALQFHSRRLELVETTGCDFSALREDVIALILLGEVKALQESSNVSEILNRCAKLLQGLVDKLKKSKVANKETLLRAKAFLARVFLSKALLNARRKYDDDAVACFQRALTWNEGDPEIILHFARFLLERNQQEESLALWQMYKDAKQSFKKPASTTLNHLLGDQMNSDDREETVCRLGSLETA